MVDPGIAQAIVKQLNRWYRRRSQPHGAIDHFYRGTRMSYTRTKCIVACFMSLFLFAIAAGAFLVPSISEDKSIWLVVLFKLAAIGMATIGVLASLQAFCEFVVVTDDGLIKSDLFGRKTQWAWADIVTFQIKPDDNKVTFRNQAKAKLTMSLAYDGWQDFLETAARRLNPLLFPQFKFALANVNVKRRAMPVIKKIQVKKWLTTKRSP